MNAVTEIDSRSVLSHVKDLTGEIQDRVTDIEAQRRLPADLHDRLRDAGIYRLLVPASHGGLDAGVDEVFDVMETLASVDGSVGWVATLGIQTPHVLSLLPRETFDELYAAGPDVTVGGVFAPQGRAEVVDGGFTVSGRWAFASGSDNWDYLLANCVLLENGEPVIGPDGMPGSRAVLVPRSEVQFIDTWHTLGLRGTGSQDFSVDGLFVPAARSFNIHARPCVDSIYQYPMVEFGLHLATVAIGVAQAALNELSESAAARQRMFARTNVAANPAIQNRVGKAQTSLRAARELTRNQAKALMSGEAGDDFLALMVTTSSNNAWVIDTCIEVVSTCFRAYGARGIYDGASLQRRLRDIYTIAQHATLNDGAWTRQGAQIFGQEIGPAV